MKTHLQDGGAFISNLISDMDIRGLSQEAHRKVTDFGLEWKRSTSSHFKFVSFDLNYQDFLDSIRTT